MSQKNICDRYLAELYMRFSGSISQRISEIANKGFIHNTMFISIYV